jgi:glycosyltransferase involved in cell wall biosynthesis
LEAELAGCTLVLGDIPSPREVWGDAAVFVPPDQPDVLAAVLQRLITDVSWREFMAQRARALRYTPERMVREYVTLYAHLIRMRTPVLLVS